MAGRGACARERRPRRTRAPFRQIGIAMTNITGEHHRAFRALTSDENITSRSSVASRATRPQPPSWPSTHARPPKRAASPHSRSGRSSFRSPTSWSSPTMTGGQHERRPGAPPSVRPRHPFRMPRPHRPWRSRRSQPQLKQGQPGDDNPAHAGRSTRTAHRRPCAARRGLVARHDRAYREHDILSNQWPTHGPRLWVEVTFVAATYRHDAPWRQDRFAPIGRRALSSQEPTLSAPCCPGLLPLSIWQHL